MTWKAEVDEISRRKELAKRLGGEESVAFHHGQGKLTARERIDLALDEGSFSEIGPMTGQATYDKNGNLVKMIPANVVIGQGRIDGSTVVVAAEDFTVRGGSSEASNSDKWLFAENLALYMKQPLIRLVDMAGGSVKIVEKAGASKLPGYSTWPFVDLLSEVPVVGIALGAVAGGGAYRVVCSHFSLMVKGTSQVFVAGPPVVERATFKKITKEELGGYRVHARGSGVVDNEADSEADAMAQARRFLSYLPPNVYELPPVKESNDDPKRKEEELLSIIPRERRKTYDPRKIINLVFDRGSVFEIGRHQGPSVVSALARINGRPVGVMINDPRFYGGAMTVSSAEKIIRFIDTCDTFHLPVINFADQPGNLVGLEAEKAGTVRYGVRVLQAMEQSRTPWVAIIIRRAFGVAGAGYGRATKGINLRFAWPSGIWGSLPLEGGVKAAYKKEIAAASDPEAKTKELESFYTQFYSPFRTAERFGILDIIDPRETRPLLCSWIEQAYRILPRQLGPTQRGMRV
jgi:acetyl-CoA carboxylase carboxyltransferase component